MSLRPRVVLPPGDRLEIHVGQLPVPHRVLEPRPEPRLLFGVTHREPVLAQQNPVFDQEPLEDRALVQEPLVLLLRAQVHDVLDARTVVPGPVEKHDLTGTRQLVHVTLEVPLRALAVARRRERHDARDTWVEVLRQPLDRAALAGRVTPFEHHDEALVLGAHPLLECHQFGLEPQQLLLVEPFGESATRSLSRVTAVRFVFPMAHVEPTLATEVDRSR